MGERRSQVRADVLALAISLAAIILATGNLSGLGIGGQALLYDTLALPRLAVALVALPVTAAIWAAGAWRTGGGVRFTPALIALLGLALWAGVSAAMSPHAALAVLGQSERLEGVVTIALYALAYGLGVNIVSSQRDVRRLASWVAGASGLLALYGLLQVAGLDPADYAVEGFGFELRRAFATFGNPNFFAGLLVIALPIAFALTVAARDRVRSIAFAAVTAATAAALFATFTRGAWLAVLVEVGVAAVLVLGGGRRIEGRSKSLALGLAALVAVAVLASLFAGGELNVAQRLGNIASGQERLYNAQGGIAAAAERPLLGWGPDAFLSAFRQNRPEPYAASFGAEATVNNAHNWPLQYAATVGWVGAALLVAAIALALWTARRCLASDNVTASPVSAGVWIGALGFFVHMLFNVAMIGSTIPFWVLLGAIGVPAARSLRLPVLAARGVSVAFTVLAVGALVVSVTLVRADAVYLQSRFAYHDGDFERAASLAESASSRNPLSIKYARGAAQARARLATDAATGAPPADYRAMVDVAIAAFDRALAVDSRDYATLAWKSAFLAEAGRTLTDPALLEQARDTARRAALLDRHHTQVASIASGETGPDALLKARAVQPHP